jgi:hypothetical protein
MPVLKCRAFNTFFFIKLRLAIAARTNVGGAFSILATNTECDAVLFSVKRRLSKPL